MKRCPNGWKRGFFQQHIQGVPGLRRIDVVDDGDSNRVLLDDEIGLLSLAQMNVSYYTWARTGMTSRTGFARFSFPDSDPDVKWPAIVAAARLIRQRLGDSKDRVYAKLTVERGFTSAAIPVTITWDCAREFLS